MMKIQLQAAVCTMALAALLSGPAARATDVADLPLKSSVLAKPNVIFGLDDSGSMDGEVMLRNNDGAFWWDFNAGSGWDAAGTTHFNAGGSSGAQWRKMIYLFPNGTGEGNRVYADSANDHFAIPPTAEFAFVRSPDINPLYFNPDVQYKPWSPAYVGGAVVNYANADPEAAKSHPAYGTGTFDVKNARAMSTAGNWVFTAFPGMTLPAGSKKNVCNNGNGGCAGWVDVVADEKADANKVTRLAMEYFPATYYRLEDCAVDGSGCVTAPDGRKLKRYEIKRAGYASEAAYDSAIQNFANWWQYYRKRKLMLSAAVGQVLEPLTGMRLGAIRFNSRPAAGTRITMYDTDVSSAANNARRVAGFFYATNGSGGTPTRETLDRIGEEYMNAAGPVQYACQRNATFIMTDGFANVATPATPAYDKVTWGSGAPYETTHDDSLADIALAYYTVNIRSDLAAGKLPPTATDTNTNLHMNTYGLTMGARGLLYTGEDAAPPVADTWTAPTLNRHPSAVDDLWHATLNGRGKMYIADSPTETAIRIQAALTDIASQTGAQGGVAVSTVNLSRGDNRAYFGTYNPSGWQGDIAAHPIDAATGAVDEATTLWSASAELGARDWTTRIIATATGAGGSAFTAANVGGVVNPGGVYGSDDDVLDYLRGERTGEGTAFRTRLSLIGAVINSEPAVQRAQNVIYVQSGEGMLHAIDTAAATAGSELWAFVPPAVLPNIGETSQRSYVFRTQLDGSPTVGTYAGGTLLVAGMGAAGNGFYALDVSAPRELTEAQLAGNYLWQFPAAGDAAKVGQALGRPRIVKTSGDGYAVLVTSGYNSTLDGHGRLWMLNASTGAVIHEFDTGVGTLATEAGLAQVSGFAANDGTVRYVYGGDLRGNVWRFDLDGKGAPYKVATLKNDAGTVQPVTAAPELSQIEGKRVVLIGTGRILDISDFGSTGVQTMYAIADGATLANARASLVEQVYTLGTDSITDNPVDWATDRGWYVDLPAGEQANTSPTIAYGAVAFVTNKNGGTDCSASSRLYVLDLMSGGRFAGTDFVSSEISGTASSSGVTALSTNQGKIVGSGQDADGQPWEREIVGTKPIAPAKNAWREIRRQ
jgi:type IV pilus assembly protein PilY1